MKIDTIQKRSNPKLQDVVKYTTRWETIKETLAGILFIGGGIGIVWVLLVMGL